MLGLTHPVTENRTAYKEGSSNVVNKPKKTIKDGNNQFEIEIMHGTFIYTLNSQEDKPHTSYYSLLC